MLARELTAELLCYDLSTQTWSLTFVVEVDTVDSVLISIQSQIATDTAPKTSTVELENVLGITLDVSHEYRSTVHVDGVIYQ